MSARRTAIVWFRRDLRLTDNPALLHALAHADRILPLYIFAPEEEAPWEPGAASRWWLHHSLHALKRSLQTRGADLVVRRGPTLPTLRALIAESGATSVALNRLYEPAALVRDALISRELGAEGVEVASFNGSLLFEPESLRTRQQQPYRVFTPFWRAAQAALPARLNAPPCKAPRHISMASGRLSSLAVEDLQLLPRIAWDAGLAEAWKPGEAGALERLESFAPLAAAYELGRDRPDLPHTSRLSAYLHHGEIGPRQVLAAIAPIEGAGAYVRQLAWREFAYHLLYHFPHTADRSFDERFDTMRWSRRRTHAEAWRRGMTGYPLVDAGMRELWRTGWMHNRVRMVVASFLTKNLQIHWLTGARWFQDTLVDADLANNTLGWQWTAGCAVDAAPYHRIFNPVLQAERFDPQRRYIRRWIPELAGLDDRWIHQPWAAPKSVLEHAGVQLGRSYPRPVVDLKASRAAALRWRAQLRNA